MHKNIVRLAEQQTEGCQDGGQLKLPPKFGTTGGRVIMQSRSCTDSSKSYSGGMIAKSMFLLRDEKYSHATY